MFDLGDRIPYNDIRSSTFTLRDLSADTIGSLHALLSVTLAGSILEVTTVLDRALRHARAR